MEGTWKNLELMAGVLDYWGKKRDCFAVECRWKKCLINSKWGPKITEVQNAVYSDTVQKSPNFHTYTHTQKAQK